MVWVGPFCFPAILSIGVLIWVLLSSVVIATLLLSGLSPTMPSQTHLQTIAPISSPLPKLTHKHSRIPLLVYPSLEGASHPPGTRLLTLASLAPKNSPPTR
jgi:hypothetical protein